MERGLAKMNRIVPKCATLIAIIWEIALLLMHLAYTLSPILDKLAFQIESVTGYGKVLLIGTKQGHLWRYNLEIGVEVKLSDTFNNFSKKPIIQIYSDTKLKLLISLSDNLISVHDLEVLSLITTINKTKGATYFCIDFQEINTPNLNSQLRICVLIKKKLQFFIWKNKTFIELYPDLNLPDVPKKLLWYKNSILFATKSDYSMIEITTGNVKELFPAGKNGEPKMCFMQLHPPIMPKDGITTNKGDKIKNSPSPIPNEINGNDKMFEIKESEKLNDTKIVACLCKDDMTILMDLDSRSINKTVITWTEAPSLLKFHNPYLIALISQGIEVRSVQPRLLLQNVAIARPKGMEISRDRDKIFVWTSSTLYLLSPVPTRLQIVKLVENEHFDLALHLSDVNTEMSVQDKVANSRRIRVLYARNLFGQKRYREAMGMFSRLKIEPKQVLSLFPNILPSEFLYPDQGESHPTADELKVGGDSPTPTTRTPSPPTLDGCGQSADHQLITSGYDGLDGADLDNALLALIEYLTEMRRFSLTSLPASGKSEMGNGSIGKSVEIENEKNEKLARDLQILDTTLLKCYLCTNDALVAPLLRISNNYCDATESERMLKKALKYAELLILYQRKGMHGKALELLIKHAKRLRSPLFGYSQIVSYLQHLGPHNLDLIFEYAGKVMKESPDDGLKIFIEDIPEVEALNREKILYFLIKHNTDLIIPYLEFVINEWRDETVLFHNTLINQYREKLMLEFENYKICCDTKEEYENYINLNQMIGLDNVRRRGSSKRSINGLEYEELLAEDATKVLLPENEADDNKPEDEDKEDIGYYENGQKKAKIASRIKQLRYKLRCILQTSHSYMPETLVSNFPIQNFNVERALLFGRLGRHDTTLAIYCHILNDLELGLQHCRQYYDPHDKLMSQLYFTLFVTLMDPPDLVSLEILPPASPSQPFQVKPEPDLSSALRVLSENAEKIPITSVLSKLPPQIELSQIMDYVVTSIKTSCEKRNSDQILKGLLFSKLLRVQEEKFAILSQKISLSDENACKMCKKRIGASAFVRFPDNSIVHYYCYKETI